MAGESSVLEKRRKPKQKKKNKTKNEENSPESHKKCEKPKNMSNIRHAANQAHAKPRLMLKSSQGRHTESGERERELYLFSERRR